MPDPSAPRRTADAPSAPPPASAAGSAPADASGVDHADASAGPTTPPPPPARAHWSSAPPPLVPAAPFPGGDRSAPSIAARPRSLTATTGALSVASLVAGGAALLTAVPPVVGVLAALVAVAGLVLGILALVARARRRGLAITGTALSGVALVVALTMTLGWGVVWEHDVSRRAAADVRRQLDAAARSGSGSSGSSDSGSGTSSSGSGGSSGSGSSSDGSGETSDDYDIVAFGDSSVYDDGIELSVGTPVVWTPPATASHGGAGTTILFTVTLRNGSSTPFSPLASAIIYSGPSARRGVAVSDPTTGVGMPPFSEVPAGGVVSWKLAYTVTDPSVLEVDIAPDGPDGYSAFGYTARYTSSDDLDGGADDGAASGALFRPAAGR